MSVSKCTCTRTTTENNVRKNRFLEPVCIKSHVWLQNVFELIHEGPPFFKIAVAIIDHAANIGQISIKPHPKTHFEKYNPVVILYNS